MSKKIVIELSENLAEIIRWFLKAKCPFSSKEVVKQITHQLESKVERSVIEWHHPELVEEDGKQFWIDIPEWEKCGESEQVIAISKQGCLSAINVEFVELDDADGYCLSGVFPDGEDWEDYEAWAYLPVKE